MVVVMQNPSGTSDSPTYTSEESGFDQSPIL